MKLGLKKEGNGRVRVNCEEIVRRGRKWRMREGRGRERSCEEGE